MGKYNWNYSKGLLAKKEFLDINDMKIMYQNSMTGKLFE